MRLCVIACILGKHPYCWHVPSRAVAYCPDRYYSFRYTYNWYTQKCEDYIDCQSSTNGFGRREDCLRQCYPESICLKNQWSYGGTSRTWYTYDPEEDECMEAISTISAASLWPVSNLFSSALQCRRACKPAFVQDRR
uniref:Pancreatic trypsin inhibitor n=1 Tax=Rhipicephalus zambeziensis TaxID=60191 RepID=A0A224Y2K0_9ACAR